MIRPGASGTLLWTALFALLAALVEAWLYERAYAISARPVLAYAELTINALPLALLAAAGAFLVARALGTRPHRAVPVRMDLVAGGAMLSGVSISAAARIGRGIGDRGDLAWPVAVAALGLCLVALGWFGRRLSAWARRAALVVIAVLLVGEPLRAPIARWRARFAREGEGPNVVLIVVDTLRADALSCHGHPIETSPAIDALAARGVRYARAYAQASWTLPATASIHTGLMPSSHGANARGRALSSGARTLAELLGAAGRRCAGFSENHVVSERYGFAQGFDWFWSYWLPWISDETLTDRICRRGGFPRATLTPRREYPLDPTSPSDLNWDAKRTTDQALRWVEAVAAGGSRFFLYVHYMGPHGPYGPPEFLLEGAPPARAIADHPREMGGGRPLAPEGRRLPEDELALVKTLYAADVRYVDREIGRLLGAIESLGEGDGTLVVLTSDHGEEFFEHGGWNHGGSVFEEIVHVPLVLAGPGVPEGEILTEPVRHVDVMPMILSLAGVPCPRVDGRDVLHDGSPGGGVLVEGCLIRPEGVEATALVEGSDKLVRVVGETQAVTLLYDLERDPLEQHDRSASAPVIADSLRAALALSERAARAQTLERRRVPLDPESARALRRLGYLQ